MTLIFHPFDFRIFFRPDHLTGIFEDKNSAIPALAF